MAHYGFDGALAFVLLPKPGGDTVNSQPFTVPRGAVAMTIHCPTLAGGPDTLTVQALDPPTSDQVTEVWRTLSQMTGVTAVPLTAIAATGIALVWPITMVGGGVLRFVASGTQAVAPVTIKVTFHMRG